MIKINLGFLSVLTLIFVIFKILGYFSCPWLWVFAPLWLPVVLALGILCVVGMAIFVGFVIESKCS